MVGMVRRIDIMQYLDLDGHERQRYAQSSNGIDVPTFGCQRCVQLVPMKTILITGCSHSAGVELADRLIFDDYDTAIQKLRTLSLYEAHKLRLKNQIKYLLKNYDNKYFKSAFINDKIKTGDIASRYFRNIEKRKSWPSVLKNNLSDFHVENLAYGGNSFKLNVKNTFEYLRSNDQVSHCIYQVPTYTRTYIKHNGKAHNIIHIEDLERLESIHDGDDAMLKDISKLKKRYKTLVKRDVTNGYFKKAIARFVDLVEKNADGIKTFYILENDEIAHFFPKDKVIMADFKSFRSKYQIGQSHVIDTRFAKDMADFVAHKIGVK